MSKNFGLDKVPISKGDYTCKCGNDKFFKKRCGLVCTKCRQIFNKKSGHKIKKKNAIVRWFQGYMNRINS